MMRKITTIVFAVFLAAFLCGCDHGNAVDPETDAFSAQGEITGQPEVPDETGKQPETPDETGKQPEVPDETEKLPEVSDETGKQPETPDKTEKQPEVPDETGKQPEASDETGKQPETPDEASETSAQEKESDSSSKRTDRTNLVLGKWYNREDMSEEWVFSENNKVTINGEEYDFAARWLLFLGDRLKVGDKNFSIYADSDRLWLLGDTESITLLSEHSEEYKSFVRTQTILEACSGLLSRYPDEDGWIMSGRCGDIPLLADADYIERSMETGFLVSTPEELASFCYFVNTQDYYFFAMQLLCDIDLSGYEWAPMGWYTGQKDHPFCCIVDGAGHTIKNMTIHSKEDSVGFIGWETGCYVADITFENASVTGDNMVGIVAGQAIGGVYENVTVSGTVKGFSAGAMLGWDASCRKKNCVTDVTVNGETFDFLSYNDSEKSKIVIENPVTITIDENHTVTRPKVEGYHNLGWLVFYNGEQVLDRNAENEYSYTYFLKDRGTYEICLMAYVSGQYVPISNTVSYTIE